MFELRLTKFHADDHTPNHFSAPSTLDRAVVSRHRTYEAAERKMRSLKRDTDCECGCYVIVDDAPARMAARIRNAKSLDTLASALNEYEAQGRDFQDEVDHLVDTTSLPTFGGDDIDATGVWSWDETRVLLCPGSVDRYGNKWQIETRKDWEETRRIR